MKRILTFLLIILIILIIGIIATAFIITPALTNPTGFVVAEVKENESNGKELPSFRVYTVAVCENTSGFIVCRDELFANCNGLEYMLPKNEVNGSGVFSKDWKDPRK